MQVYFDELHTVVEFCTVILIFDGVLNILLRGRFRRGKAGVRPSPPIKFAKHVLLEVDLGLKLQFLANLTTKVPTLEEYFKN